MTGVTGVTVSSPRTGASAGSLALAAVVVGSVLVVDPSGLAPFGPARFLAISVSTLVAVALGLGSGGLLARGPMLAWSVLLVLVALASALGLDPLYAWTGTPERHFGALTWVLCLGAFVAAQLLGRPGARLLVPVLVATVGLAGAWATVEVLGWDPIALDGAGDRPVGPMGSSAYLGAAMVLLGPVALGVAVDRARSVAFRRASALAAGLAGLALVASGARAAWVGALVAGTVVVVVVARRSGSDQERHPVRTPGVILGGAAVAVGVVVVASLTGVAGRVPDAFGNGPGGIGGRLDEWRVAVRVVAANPLTGVGPEGYRIAFGRHVDDAYQMEHGRLPLPDRAHSAVLDVATTVGLPGLLAYLALLALVGRIVVRTMATGPPWLVGLSCGLVAYAVQSLFLFPLAELDPLAWLLAGLVVTVAARPSETVTLGPARAAPAAVAVLAAVALVAGGLDVAADRRAKRSLQALASPVPAPDAVASDLRPDALRYHLVDARVHEATGTSSGLAAAVADIDEALAVSPLDPVARAERARLLLEVARRSGQASDLGPALNTLERLADDDPRNAEVLLRLGLARTLDGDEAGAEAAWLAAERLSPDSAAASTNLAVAYARQGRRDEALAAADRALARDPSSERAAAVRQDVGT